MAAVAQKFLVRSIWSLFLKMSNRRATIHTKETLASTHEDPLVGIWSVVVQVCLILAPSRRLVIYTGGIARKTASEKIGEKRGEKAKDKAFSRRASPLFFRPFIAPAN